MLHSNRWVVLVMASLQLLIYKQWSESASKEEKHAKVEHLEGTDLSRVTLSERAAERLGVKTVPVRSARVPRKRMVVGETIALPLRFRESMTSTAPVGIRVLVNENDLQGVAQDKPAHILLRGSNDEAGGLTTRAIEISAVGGLQKENGTLYFTIDGRNHNLRPGKRVRVELPLQGNGEAQKIVPYSAVIYDPQGNTWVYITIGPLAYVRYPITVDDIDADLAILSQGPPIGTEVVSVGIIELYGIETGIGK